MVNLKSFLNDDDIHNRSLDFRLQIVSDDDETSKYVFNQISDYMEKILFNFQFTGCMEGNEDVANIPFDYGCMGETKREILEVFKQAKKV